MTPNTTTIADTIDQAAPHVAALVELQARYDDDGFRIAPPRHPAWYAVRHGNHHLRKALQRLDDQVEQWEHAAYDGGEAPTDDEVAEAMHTHGLVAAELLFGALQMAERGGFDLALAWRDLIARNAKHFLPDSPFAELEQVTYTGTLDGPPVGE